MPTIKDVAKKAGVSVTTVSRVLNNRGYISDATRKKVHQAMKELNYQPNELARSLYRQKSNIIGLIVPTVSHPFFGELVSSIEYYAFKVGYKILLCNSHLEQEKEKDYIDMLRRNQVDGIILGSHTLDVREYVSSKFPIVTIDRCISDDIPYIASDNYEGGRLATTLLLKHGCKKIAHVSGNLTLDLLSNKRYEAFVKVAEENNVDYINVQTGINVFDVTQYERIIYDLLKEHPDIDGIFASSDVMAAYTIRSCHDLNKRVPEDVKIVGYDDIDIASLMIPSITTINQPINEMSELAVELIIKQIDGKKVPTKNIFPVELIERETA